MDRLATMQRTDDLAGRRVLVTGCGYKPLQTRFYDVVTGEESDDSFLLGGLEMKLNIGAATAGVLAAHGATIHMVSHSEEKLSALKEYLGRALPGAQVEYSAADLLDEGSVKSLVAGLPKDKPLSWVQSVGLGAGSYKVKDDNPYLPLEEVDTELLEAETQTVTRGTHLLMKEILPTLRAQKESRIAVISSMSAIRGYALGGAHCAAKGAIDRYANVAMLGLYKDRIYVTTIRPGIIDTGMYDAPAVQEAARRTLHEYGMDYSEGGLCAAPPTSVGEAVAYALTTKAHIPSINLVARGQSPHEGS